MSKSVTPIQSGIDGSIEVEFEEEVAILTMKRGENRMNISFVDDFNRALDIVESNKNVKALITTGQGKFYSNGLDLNWLKSADKDTDFGPKLDALVIRLLTFPVPTISAFNGHVYAGGAVLGIVHDYKVMGSARGWLCFNEVHIGRPFAPFTIELLKHKIGTDQNFTEAVVLGRRYTGPEALQAGIVQAISKGPDVITRAKQVAKHAVGMSKGGYDRVSLKAMKEAVFKPVIILSRNSQTKSSL